MIFWCGTIRTISRLGIIAALTTESRDLARTPPSHPDDHKPGANTGNMRPSSPGDPDPDADLIAQVRSGDARALGALLRRHQDGVFTHCLRILRHRQLAEDVAQDSMVKIINGLESYDGRSKFSTWIYTIVHNACLSKLRSEKYRRHASLEGMSAGNSDSDGPNDGGFAESREPSGLAGVAKNEVHARLLAALAQLEDEHRSILLLRDSRGMDYEAIAGILQVPVGTVKSRLFRARESLRKFMEQSVQTASDLSPEE